MISFNANIIDVIDKRIYPGKLNIIDGKIVDIIEKSGDLYEERFILPGLVDAHIHIESSMLVPARFAEAAVKHGTVATVSDPHEIANVLGKDGVRFMIENGSRIPFKFYFGAPSCVPATPFESSGAIIDAEEIKNMLQWEGIKYLSEMMNFPGVLNNVPEVIKKIGYAKTFNKPVDGHAPGLRGEKLKSYIEAGIRTDHECFSLDEAIEKIENGMIIQIREGSAARNFEALFPLIDLYPDNIMLCSDDLHPDQLVKGHINLLIKKGLEKGLDLFNVLRAATLNPIKFYNLDAGLLKKGDPADFIVIDNLKSFNILENYINGIQVFDGLRTLFQYQSSEIPNRFYVNTVRPDDIQVKDTNRNIRIIQAVDGELITKSILDKPQSINGYLASDTSKDYLKIVVQNRYEKETPSVGFIHNFGIKKGGMISTIAHDSHNIICVGTDDNIICGLIDWVNKNKGGIAFSDGKNIQGIPLPVAGIISNESAEIVAKKYNGLENKIKMAGSKLSAPFMTLSFMSLLVIPELKLGNKGLFDVNSFNFVSLYDN